MRKPAGATAGFKEQLHFAKYPRQLLGRFDDCHPGQHVSRRSWQCLSLARVENDRECSQWQKLRRYSLRSHYSPFVRERCLAVLRKTCDERYRLVREQWPQRVLAHMHEGVLLYWSLCLAGRKTSGEDIPRYMADWRCIYCRKPLADTKLGSLYRKDF